MDFENYCQKVCKYRNDTKEYKKLHLFDGSKSIEEDIMIPIDPCRYCQVYDYSERANKIIWRLEDRVRELSEELEYYHEEDLEKSRALGML